MPRAEGQRVFLIAAKRGNPDRETGFAMCENKIFKKAKKFY
jgi:hypothetical protein